MTPLSIIGLFCEDIREESGNILTLVGLLPDNINAEVPPLVEGAPISPSYAENRFLNKVCIYARANFDVDDPISDIQLILVFPNGQEIMLAESVADAITTAKSQAKGNGAPLAGIIMRATLANFKLQKGGGILRLEAAINSERRLLSTLNFRTKESVTSPNGSEQPS